MSQASGNGPAPQPPSQARAVRLIFEYDSAGIRLMSQQPVDMAVPVHAPLPEAAAPAPFWVEVRDEQRSALHQQPMPNPIQDNPEVFSPDPVESVARAAVPAAGAFTVVVPALPDADRVALMTVPSVSAPPPPGVAAAAASTAREIGEFSLRRPPAGEEGSRP